jgi:hypothetical protein
MHQTRVARWFILIPKTQFGYILEGLGMENVGMFYDHLEFLRPFGIIYLWPFGIVCDQVVIFYPFNVVCMFGPEKSGNLAPDICKR